MDGDRSERALARIEVALARIEAATSQTRGPEDGGEFARLRDRHNRLRSAVSESLAQLDVMIEGQRG